MARGSARGSSVGCARKERPSYSRPVVVVRASDFGRLSRPQAHLPVRGALGSAASPSSHPPSGAGSPFKPSQPNKSTSERVKNPRPSLSTGAPATAPPSSNNEFRSKAIPSGPNGKASTPGTMQVQTNGAVTIVGPTCRSEPQWLVGDDLSGFVREVLNLIYVRPFSSFHLWRLIHFPWSIR